MFRIPPHRQFRISGLGESRPFSWAILGGRALHEMTYEADELRRTWKQCSCPIYASGTLNGQFKRKNTERTAWVIPKKAKDDESDALTTALCITARAEELDRDLAAQLREFTDVYAKAATNIQKVKDELAAAEKAEREATDERRLRRRKARSFHLPPRRRNGNQRNRLNRGRHHLVCLTKATNLRRPCLRTPLIP